MVEQSPKILASEEKATTTMYTLNTAEHTLGHTGTEYSGTVHFGTLHSGTGHCGTGYSEPKEQRRTPLFFIPL